MSRALILATMSVGLSGVWVPFAEAQGVCEAITRYAVAPPSNFIADKGKQISTDMWESRTRIYGGKCSIVQKAEASELLCNMPDVKRQAAIAFMKRAETEIQKCISSMPDASKYVKKTFKEKLSDEETFTSAWERKVGKEVFGASVSRSLNDDGFAYNIVRILFERE